MVDTNMLAYGSSPFAQSEVRGGHDAATKLKRLEEMANAGGAANSYGSPDLALAQMSQLQRKQLDKDGDGIFSAAELAASGFSSVGAAAPAKSSLPRSAAPKLPPQSIERHVYQAREDSPVSFTFSSTCPPAGKGPFSVNVLQHRQPELFAGGGAAAAASYIEKPSTGSSLPRTRDKSTALASLEKNAPVARFSTVKQGFGIASELQRATRIAELHAKPLNNDNGTLLHHPVLGTVIVQKTNAPPR